MLEAGIAEVNGPAATLVLVGIGVHRLWLGRIAFHLVDTAPREWDWPAGGFAVLGRLRLDKFESHSLRERAVNGGSGIRTHVVTGTNALAGRRF